MPTVSPHKDLPTNHACYAQCLPEACARTIDCLTGRSFLEAKTASFVNSSVSIPEKELAPLRERLFQQANNEHVSIPSARGTESLDGVLVKSASGQAKGVIFFVLGSGGTYEKLADPEDLAHKMVNFFQQDVKDVDILVLNQRGIGESKGKVSCTNWEYDTYSGLKYLVSKGYESKHIMLYGHSFGSWISRGAVRAINSDLKAQQLEEICEVSDRSYSDFPSMVYHYLGGGLKGFMGYILAYLAKWTNYRVPGYTNNSKLMVISSDHDETVKKTASLAADLQARGIVTKSIELSKTAEPVHAREFTPEEKALVAKQMRAMLQLDVQAVSLNALHAGT